MIEFVHLGDMAGGAVGEGAVIPHTVHLVPFGVTRTGGEVPVPARHDEPGRDPAKNAP